MDAVTENIAVDVSDLELKFDAGSHARRGSTDHHLVPHSSWRPVIHYHGHTNGGFAGVQVRRQEIGTEPLGVTKYGRRREYLERPIPPP